MHPDYEILGAVVTGKKALVAVCLRCLLAVGSWNTKLITINCIPSVVGNLGRWYMDALDSRSCIYGIWSTTMPNFTALVQFLNVL